MVRLTERQLNIPKAYARKLGKANDSLIEELESIGNLALIEAATDFDPSYGCTVDTHLINRVKWAMMAYLDPKRNKWLTFLSVDQSEDENLPLKDKLIGDVPNQSLEQEDSIKTALSRLSPLLRAIYILRVARGKEFKEIAELVGCAASTARRYFLCAQKILNNATEARVLSGLRFAVRYKDELQKSPYYCKPPRSENQRKAVTKAGKERHIARRLMGDLPKGKSARYIAHDERKQVAGPALFLHLLIKDVGLTLPDNMPRGRGRLPKLLTLIESHGYRVVDGNEATELIRNDYSLIGAYKPLKQRRDNVMARQPLPDRRKNWTIKVEIEGQTFYLTCGEYPDGKLGEIFINANKTGTFVQGTLDGFARTVSRSLQYGMPVEEVIKSFHLLNFPPNGTVTGSQYVTQATSVYDWVAQEISAVYCSGQQVPRSAKMPDVDKSFGYIAESWRSGV